MGGAFGFGVEPVEVLVRDGPRQVALGGEAGAFIHVAGETEHVGGGVVGVAVGKEGDAAHLAVTAVAEEEVWPGVAEVLLFVHHPLLPGGEADVPLHAGGGGPLGDLRVAVLERLAQGFAEADFQLAALVDNRSFALWVPGDRGRVRCRVGVVLVGEDGQQRTLRGGARGDLDLLRAGVRQQALRAG